MLLYLTLNLPTDFSNLAITHDRAESYQRSPCRKIRKKRQKFVFDLGKRKMEGTTTENGEYSFFLSQGEKV